MISSFLIKIHSSPYWVPQSSNQALPNNLFRSCSIQYRNYCDSTSTHKYPPSIERFFPLTINGLIDRSHSLTSKQSKLLRLSVSEAIAELKAGRTSSVELVESCLIQMKRTKALNSYISSISEVKVLQRAKVLDQIRKSDPTKAGLLQGIPVAVKDNFCVKDTYTTCGSKMLHSYNSPYDSTVTERLEKEGAILIGKTNLDEFAMGSSTINSLYGPTVNPWTMALQTDAVEQEENLSVNLWEKTPNTVTNKHFLACGGSSGGSAAAVASGTAFCATGTDTGGSVRLPAAWTGLVGFKPTYGTSSRFGMVQYASSLDTPSIFSRTVEDAKLLFRIIKGADPNDSTSVLPRCFEELEKIVGIRKIRVGIPREYNVEELSNETREIWQIGIEWLQKSGKFDIYDISLPHTRLALPAYYIIAPAEASSNLSRYDGIRYGHRSQKQDATTVKDLYSQSRSEGFGEEVQRRILIGTFALSRKSYDSFYKKALQIRRLVRDDFRKVFGQFNPDSSRNHSNNLDNSTSARNVQQNNREMGYGSFVDVILTPTAPTAAPSITQFKSMDPIHHYITDIMTIPANLAGLPAISVPAGLDHSGLPVGLQLIGPSFQDELVLHAASTLENLFAASGHNHKSLDAFFR